MLHRMSQADQVSVDHQFAMGATTVTMASDGAVTAARHPRRDHSMLLAEGAPDPGARGVSPRALTQPRNSCAFVYPSCVNGQPAHAADPLANDQDWALVYALRHGLGADDH